MMLFTGLGAWLGKLWAGRILQNQIGAQQAELVKLKSELGCLSKEHEITFTKLHEKRAEGIREIHAHLLRLRNSSRQLLAAEKLTHPLVDSIIALIKESKKSFDDNCLYLEEDLYRKIENFFWDTVDLQEQIASSIPDASDTTPQKTDLGKNRNDLEKRVEQLETFLKELQNQFRNLLGVPKSA